MEELGNGEETMERVAKKYVGVRCGISVKNKNKKGVNFGIVCFALAHFWSVIFCVRKGRRLARQADPALLLTAASQLDI
jgi:hypothetical protein